MISSTAHCAQRCRQTRQYADSPSATAVGPAGRQHQQRAQPPSPSSTAQRMASLTRRRPPTLSDRPAHVSRPGPRRRNRAVHQPASTASQHAVQHPDLVLHGPAAARQKASSASVPRPGDPGPAAAGPTGCAPPAAQSFQRGFVAGGFGGGLGAGMGSGCIDARGLE